MAHTFVARMKVFPEKQAQFIDACERMEKAVKENEPDALIYQFFRLREPNAFAVIESFKTEAADEAHQQSAHFKEIAPSMIECIDGGWEREYLDPLKK
ncbi:putative quinol monooxygenase [Hyphococcus sp.]|uniref:putative quinol monooxygenase n=1 Tax=Hyphococcus sp. TaxID=2038636 RepID=UPI003CCBA477